MPAINGPEGTALATTMASGIAFAVERQEVASYDALYTNATEAAALTARGVEPADPAVAALVEQCATDPRSANVVDCLQGMANAALVAEGLHNYLKLGAGAFAVGGLAFAGISQVVRGLRNHFRDRAQTRV